MPDALCRSDLHEDIDRAIHMLRRQHAADPDVEDAVALLRVVKNDHRGCADLFEHAPDPYLVTDRRGTVQQLNGRAMALFGASADSRSIIDLVHSDHRTTLDAAVRSLGDDQRHALTLSFETREGEKLLETHVRSLRNEHILWLLRDTSGIDEIRDNMAALAQRDRAAARELRELDQLRSAFLLTVSHDLRTPLATIAGIADLLSVADQPETTRIDLSTKLRDLAGQVFRDFNNLLDVERIEQGNRGIRRRHVDVARLLEQICATVDLGARRLEVDIPATDAQIDPVLVARMVHNLLHNAGRHTPEGTTIWLRCSREEDAALIVVEDDGPGVPAERRDAVFELFARGRSHPDGLGVGLHLVRRFAELHDGDVVLEPRQGGGASFRIRLPDRV